MRRSILLGIMPTIIMAGASRRSTRIVRSSALLYFGRGGGGSSAFVPVHLAGRRKLSSDAVSDIVNSNHKINHVSCINVDAHPRHHEMAVVCDDCTVHDYDDGHDIPPGENYCYLLRSLEALVERGVGDHGHMLQLLAASSTRYPPCNLSGRGSMLIGPEFSARRWDLTRMQGR